VVILGKVYKWADLSVFMVNRWYLLLIMALAFLSACSVDAEQPEHGFITFEVDDADSLGTYTLQTFEISEQSEDLFDKWERVNGQRILDDQWDSRFEEKRELEIDADLSDDWIKCDRSILLDVEVENLGDVDEDEVIVHVFNQELGIDEVKVTDIDVGFMDVLRFPLAISGERGNYQIDVEVFIDGDVDEFQTVKNCLWRTAGNRFKYSFSFLLFQRWCLSRY
jgi:hypothetical protein